MKQFLIALLALAALALLPGCDDADKGKPQEPKVKDAKNGDDIKWSVRKFGNHQYVVGLVSGYRDAISIVHDPDCPCPPK